MIMESGGSSQLSHPFYASIHETCSYLAGYLEATGELQHSRTGACFVLDITPLPEAAVTKLADVTWGKVKIAGQLL